jgi:RNA polymerase sigma-70 factor (ECF subfamily)
MAADDQTLPALDSPRRPRPSAPIEVASVEDPKVRLRRMVDGHYDAVWRTVRFLGVPDASAEDVAQQTFCVAARKLDEITPGGELPYLLSIAWRVSSEHRRAASRRPAASDADVEALAAPLPSPEQLLDQKRARAELQAVLGAMPAELRMVFVLFEIEELTGPEIAAATGVNLGTVTSRLRRAREEFQSIVKRRTAVAGRKRGRSGGSQ